MTSSACSGGETPSEPELAWRDAPLSIEPGVGEGDVPLLVAPDATVPGFGRGWLIVEGGSLRVEAGAIGADAFEVDEVGALRIVADAAEVPELPPELEASPGAASLDARAIVLDGVVIADYEQARFLGGDPLVGELEVAGSVLLWDDVDGRLVIADSDEAAPRSELGHTAGIGGVAVKLVAASGDVGAPAGSPCTATAECDAELACVEDAAMPGFLCAPVCVESLAEERVHCSDDASCCDPAGVCNEGVCLVPGSDDGTTPEEEPGAGSEITDACGDRDHDSVRNGCDQNPDQSCSADADGDGCNNSCDADDTDGCLGGSSGDDGLFCRVPRLPRPNSTFYALVLLCLAKGRRRRRRRW